MESLDDFFKIKNFEFDEKNYIKTLYENKKPFTYSFTSGSSKLESENFKKGFYGQRIDFSIFPIYRKICKRLASVDIKKEGMDRSDCSYVGFNAYLLDYSFEDWDIYRDFYTTNRVDVSITNKVYGCDITMAYPSFAFKLGWIDEKDFEKLKTIDKISRLACFGMLATRTHSVHFDGQNFGNIKKSKNHLAPFFYRLVYETDSLLLGCMERFNDFSIFYWVDCIFFYDKKNIEKIKAYFLENGLKTNVFQCFEFKQIVDTKTIFRFSYKKRKKNAIVEKKEYVFNINQSFVSKKEYIKKIGKII